LPERAFVANTIEQVNGVSVFIGEWSERLVFDCDDYGSVIHVIPTRLDYGVVSVGVGCVVGAISYELSKYSTVNSGTEGFGIDWANAELTIIKLDNTKTAMSKRVALFLMLIPNNINLLHVKSSFCRETLTQKILTSSNSIYLRLFCSFSVS
jgi:hypothetical protein